MRMKWKSRQNKFHVNFILTNVHSTSFQFLPMQEPKIVTYAFPPSRPKGSFRAEEAMFDERPGNM